MNRKNLKTEMKPKEADELLDKMSDSQVDEAYDGLMGVTNVAATIGKPNKNRNILSKQPELTEDQVESICNVLANNKSKDSELLSNLPSNNGVSEAKEDVIEVVQDEADVTIDPNSGMRLASDAHVAVVSNGSQRPALSDILNAKVQVKVDTISDKAAEKLKSSLQIIDDKLSSEDVTGLIDIINRKKAGEKFNVYNALPDAFKNQVKKLCMQTGSVNIQTLNAAANSIVLHFMNELTVDQEFIDFEESLKKELNVTDGLMEMFNKRQKELMEEKLLRDADKLQEKFPDKAEMLRKISASFKEAYTFDKWKEALNKNRKFKPKNREMSKYERVFEDFNRKYEHSKFRINNVGLIVNTLDRVLPKEDITNEDIIGFAVSFCKYTVNMSPENVDEHTFMYYTIKNILTLDHVDVEESEFSQLLIKNILEIINILKQKGGNN